MKRPRTMNSAGRSETGADLIESKCARTRVQALAVAVMLCYFAVNALIAARTHSPTVDEFVDIPIGLYHLETRRFDMDRGNPPLVKMLTAVPLLFHDVRLDLDPRWRGDGDGWWPWVFGTKFMYDNAAAYLDLFFVGRTVIIGLGTLLGLGVFFWARRLFGPTVALGALLLYSTCPTVLGHVSLATLDVGVTTFLFGGFLSLFHLARTKSGTWAAVSGTLFGLALAAKFTTLFFLPLIPLLLAVEWRPRDRAGMLHSVGMLALLGFFFVLGIDVGYLFSGLPLPWSVIEGIRLRIQIGQAGESPSFLLGAWADKSWRSYYLVAMLYKMPIPFLLLLVVGMFGLLRGMLPWKTAAWIVLPAPVLLYVMSFHYQINYGIRWLLPVIPFLTLIAAFGMLMLLRGNRFAAGFLWVLLAWQVTTSFFAAPHHLAYFNELAGGPDRAREILLDSNLDWGQDLGRLKSYMTAHRISSIQLGYFGHVDPRLYGIQYTLPPSTPEPGIYAISANYLKGYPYAITYLGPEVYNVPTGAWTWLDNYEPIARVGRSIFIFKIDLPRNVTQDLPN